MNNEITVELLLGYLSGKLSKENNKRVSKWIDASDKNKSYFHELKEAWDQQIATGAELTNSEIEESWQEVKSRTLHSSNYQAHGLGRSKWNKVFPLFQKIAAVLIIGFAIGFMVNRFLDRVEESVTFKSTATDLQELMLPDGTKVWLNKSSTLSYAKDFNRDGRVVSLIGEGFFEVERNPEKPFVVRSDNMSVKVLGTSFNIDNRAKEQLVTVASGKVAVFDPSNSESHVDLIKGQVAIFNKTNQQISKTENVDLNFLAWKTGILTFEGSSLLATVQTLEKHFDRKFNISNEIEDNFIFNSSFDNQSLEEILLVMEFSLGLKFEQQKNQIFISTK